MKCAVCSRKAKGFGYFNPRLPRSDPGRYSDRWVFCSMRCQNAFCKLMTKTEGQMIDPSEMELAAMASCLAPLGEYVGSIGMQRPLADYSKDEVLTLIDVVVTAYQEHMLVEQVLDANAAAGSLVLIARADAAAGGADLLVAERLLGQGIHLAVIRGDDVRVGRNLQLRGVHAARLQLLDLLLV